MEENLTNEMPDIKPYEETPEIPQFLKNVQWYDIDIDSDFLPFDEPYRPPRYMLSHDGIPFANIGDLHVVSGKAGHGKTNLMSQLMATILCGKFGRLKYEQSEAIPKPVILYIDTEQGKDDTIAIKNRVCTLAGIDYTKPCDQFKILRLRDTEEAADRWRKILKAVYVVKPNVIFLDGMLDIVNDYNNQEECAPIIRQCMMLSTHYDVSLWLVLHENPMADKLVGTLGSITQRKATEVFAVRKHKQSEEAKRVENRPDIYFTVKQLKARGRDAKDWDFEVVPGTGGWGMPLELDDLGDHINDPEAEQRRKERAEADDYFKQFNWTSVGTTYTDLERFLRSKGVTSNRKMQSLFNTALEASIIYKSEKKKYYYNGLKEIPNDKTEDIPFEKPADNEEAPF